MPFKRNRRSVCVCSSSNGDTSTLGDSPSPWSSSPHRGRLPINMDSAPESHPATPALPRRRAWPRRQIVLRGLVSHGRSDARRSTRIVPTALRPRSRATASASARLPVWCFPSNLTRIAYRPSTVEQRDFVPKLTVTYSNNSLSFAVYISQLLYSRCFAVGKNCMTISSIFFYFSWCVILYFLITTWAELPEIKKYPNEWTNEQE